MTFAPEKVTIGEDCYIERDIMFIHVSGVYVAYVCPNCGGENVGGFGPTLHCFGGCESDVKREECPTRPMTEQEKLEYAGREAY